MGTGFRHTLCYVGSSWTRDHNKSYSTEKLPLSSVSSVLFIEKLPVLFNGTLNLNLTFKAKNITVC